jgi:hypothetical protein
MGVPAHGPGLAVAVLHLPRGQAVCTLANPSTKKLLDMCKLVGAGARPAMLAFGGSQAGPSNRPLLSSTAEGSTAEGSTRSQPNCAACVPETTLRIP